MPQTPDAPHVAIQDGRRLAELARTIASAKELADKVAGSSEETAALFDSRYRAQSELGVNPRHDAP
jgi:hypothetical protein